MDSLLPELVEAATVVPALFNSSKSRSLPAPSVVSRSNVSKRATTLLAGIGTLIKRVPAAPVRHAVFICASVSTLPGTDWPMVCALRMTSFKPPVVAPTLPAKPVDRVSERKPLTVLACTSAGACTERPERAVTGLRTECTPSLHTSAPYCHTLSGAVVRVRVTVNDLVSPGARLRLLGATATV